MDTTRQNKFARLIQKEIGELLQREGANYYGNAFVTVTGVKVSPDLGYVKVYLSIMGTADRNKVVQQLNDHTRDVRRRLGMRIKNQIRHIPELTFFLDDSFDYAEKIDKLFREINRPEKEDSED
jgi:ribosome-binding factor A